MVAVLGLQTIGLIAWTYSVHVIYWIRGQSWRFKPFVANRVGEIQPLTDPEQWRYVLLTRGLSVSALGEEGRWWSGPSLLKQDPSEWPQTRIVKREVRKLCQAKELRVEQTFASLITRRPATASEILKLDETDNNCSLGQPLYRELPSTNCHRGFCGYYRPRTSECNCGSRRLNQLQTIDLPVKRPY